MAYEQVSVTAITDIPAVVAAFAAANGWTVDGQKYRFDTGVQFTLGASITGVDHDLWWSATSDSRVTNGAKIRSPKLNGTSAVPQVSIPSSVHLFAGTDPAPYLAIVIEYGFNSYRHLYFGYLEKHGFDSGGEVVSGTTFPASNSQFDYPMDWRQSTVQYLFSGANHWGVEWKGGVLVDHPDNPNKWRRFNGTNGYNSIASINDTLAIGGFKDDINDAYVARGDSSAAGITLLVPIHLYAPIGNGAAALFTPIGAPAGVRMCRMNSLDPKSSIVISTDEWMVFPAISKGPGNVPKSLSGWGAAETSYMVGYAYRKD